MKLKEQDLDFQFVQHVAYKSCYVSVYEDKTHGVEKEVTTRRTDDGYGIGSSKVLYYIKGNKKPYKSINDILKIICKKAESI